MPTQTLRFCTPPTVIIATHLFGPTHRRRSRILNCFEGSFWRSPVYWKNKKKPRTDTAISIFGRDCAAVRFDDGTHDREAHPQTLGLRRKVLFEESLECFF